MIRNFYLAGSSDPAVRDDLEKLQRSLKGCQLRWVNKNNWLETVEDDKGHQERWVTVVEMDLAGARSCDLFVLMWHLGYPSFGAGVEVGTRLALGQPVHVVMPKDTNSLVNHPFLCHERMVLWKGAEDFVEAVYHAKCGGIEGDFRMRATFILT